MDNDFEEFDEEPESPYVLDTNEALAGLCRVIKRPTCLLDDVELDVIERPTCLLDDVELDVIEGPTVVMGGHRDDERPPFSAIADLFEHSKGRLVVTFGNLSKGSSNYVTLGAALLSARLQELRVRFCHCHIGDIQYALFLHGLRSNQSLTILELGFDAIANLGTPDSRRTGRSTLSSGRFHPGNWRPFARSSVATSQLAGVVSLALPEQGELRQGLYSRRDTSSRAAYPAATRRVLGGARMALQSPTTALR
jgi:hypothetical protein